MTTWLVVGGGSAGCVIAARLSERPDYDVTLLEAGPDHGPGAADDAAGTPVLAKPPLLWRDSAVVRRWGGSPESYAQGFGIGGSSLVNGAVVVGDPDVESVGHDLPIEVASVLGPVGRAVLTCSNGASRVGLIQRQGRRVSAADVYLEPARGRSNLTIRAGVSVDELVFDGRRAAGVVTAAGEHVEADCVVLCAGAIGTPALLLRSHVDTPGVGEGLQDHVSFPIAFDLRQVATHEVPDIGVTIERPGRQIVVVEGLEGAPAMGAVLAGHLAVQSIGRVSIPEPGAAPLVELGQLDQSVDLDGLVLVVREAFDVLRSPGLDAVIGDVYADDEGTPLAHIEGDEAVLRAWLPERLGGYHHLAGSCRIGVCVDDTLALVGYDGVYACDASALPGVPISNPYLTVVRAAERWSRRWLTNSP